MKKGWHWLAAFFVLLSTLALTAQAQAPYQTYTYSYTQDYQISPHAFEPAASHRSFGDTTLKTPNALTTDSKKKVYICDSGNNRVVILNTDYTVKALLSAFTDSKGQKTALNAPMGVFVDQKDNLFVADTNNKRIVMFNADLQFVRVIGEPKSALVSAKYEYIPVSVSVDKLGRIYVLSRDTPGIMVMDSAGNFQGYIGAQNVNVNMVDYLWRMFKTKEQLARSFQYVPINYNNLRIDNDGFLYVTSYVEDAFKLKQAISSRSAASNSSPVKKLTPSGVDVLKRNGFFPPVGDINFDVTKVTDAKKPSTITALDIRDNGVYSLVDSTYGKIFTYDDNGNLLYAFGGIGKETGFFENLCDITYQGTTLLALDKGNSSLTVFEMTEYGQLLDRVVDSQNHQRYGETVDLWYQILDKNNNYDLAYLGIGKSLLDQGQYEKAKSYFETINNKTYYSKAMSKTREQFLNRWFLAIPVIFLALIVALVKFFSFAKRYNKAHQAACASRSKREEIMYAFHVIFHPFDGFSDLKLERRGSVGSASILLCLVVFAVLFQSFASGFLFRGVQADGNSLTGVLGNFMVPFVTFCVANWCLTSLMNGEGKLKEIYITVCYGLTPVFLLFIPATILSHLLVLNEAAFVSYFITIAFFWSGLLIFFGTMVIHNYSLGKNILVSILSIVGIAIILFLVLLFLSVLGRMTSFFTNIYNEIAFRL